LFSKILRHQVDEDFRLKQQQLITHVDAQIKHCLRHPSHGSGSQAAESRDKRKWNKTQSEVEKAFADLVAAKTKVEYAVWSAVLSRMFSPSDVETLSFRLKNKRDASKSRPKVERSKSQQSSKSRERKKS
jgi:hypothetical protein